jgi:hypothetical protein
LGFCHTPNHSRDYPEPLPIVSHLSVNLQPDTPALRRGREWRERTCETWPFVGLGSAPAGPGQTTA